MQCQQCGKEAHLIRGVCADCAPSTHQARELASYYQRALSKIFEAETGKNSLGDYNDFEDWIARKAAGE